MKNYYIFKQTNIDYTQYGSCNCTTCLSSNPNFDDAIKDGRWQWYERFNDIKFFSSKAINALNDLNYGWFEKDL